MDWNICEEQIKGFGGAEFKSFTTQAETETCLADKDIILSDDIKPRLLNCVLVSYCQYVGIKKTADTRCEKTT